MPLFADEFQALRAIARRHSRVESEADDLLQDALLVATEQGRLDLAGIDRPWFAGVLANLGLRRARDAVRRKNREAEPPRPGVRDIPPLPDSAFLRTLPRSARLVATLAINGMTPDEIRHVLALTDAAYRQRLTTIRRAWNDAAPPTGRTQTVSTDLDFGVIRQALLEPARRRGHIGTHDPDGNLFLIGEVSPSQTTPPRQLKSDADT